MVSTNGFECVCYGRPRCILGFALARKRRGKDKIGGKILAKSRIFARSPMTDVIAINWQECFAYPCMQCGHPNYFNADTLDPERCNWT